MNGYQIVTVAFAFFTIGMSVFAIVSIMRSKDLRHKPVWIIGSLFGFVGLGVNWSHPDDFLLISGVMIPPVIVFKILPAGPTIIKTGFPVVAAIALWRIRSTGYIGGA